MTNVWHFIILLSIMFYGCVSHSETIDENAPSMFSVSIPTVEEEAQQLVNVLNRYKWFMDNGYTISLPNTPLIETLKNKLLAGNSLTSLEENQVREQFKNEIYRESDYQNAFTAIGNVLRTADSQIPELRRYETAWHFFIPRRYNIRLTMYSPGGQYNPNNGDITILATRSLDRDRLLQTVLHEAIHIGIENIIIQKFNVPHWTKERIVDQFASRQFRSVLPNYWMQTGNVDTSIDVIFQQADALDNLPQRVEEFMKSR